MQNKIQDLNIWTGQATMRRDQAPKIMDKYFILWALFSLDGTISLNHQTSWNRSLLDTGEHKAVRRTILALTMLCNDQSALFSDSKMHVDVKEDPSRYGLRDAKELKARTL